MEVQKQGQRTSCYSHLIWTFKFKHRAPLVAELQKGSFIEEKGREKGTGQDVEILMVSQCWLHTLHCSKLSSVIEVMDARPLMFLSSYYQSN